MCAWGKERELDATWKGRGGYNELAATFQGPDNWVVTSQDIEAFMATVGTDLQESQEESDGDSFTVTSLTASEQHELEQLTAAAEADNARRKELGCALKKGKEIASGTDLPSYQEYYNQLYQQRRKGEISQEEFRRRAEMTTPE